MAKAPLAKDSVNFSFKPETSVLGIDLGTTNIVVSLHKAGDTRGNIIVFKGGKRIMPSYAQFDETGKCVSVGEHAQRQIRITPGFVLYDAKRMIGQPYSDKLKLHQPYWAFEVKPNKDGRPVYVLKNGIEILPEVVSTELLKEVKKTIQELEKEEIVDCVITHPAYFQMEQKQATEEAARNAGFKVMAMLAEPVAAAFAYGFDHKRYEGFTLFVLDLGGGTLDVSIIKYVNGQFVTKAISGDNNLGGRDFDNALFEYFKNKLNVKFDDKDDKNNLKNKIRLREKCEEVKINLSEANMDKLDLDDGTEEITITRQLFNSLTKQLVEQIRVTCQNVLKKAGIDHNEIDKVLLIGGATRMKIIKELVDELFPNQRHDEKAGASVDEAVAFGAGIRAAQLRDPNFKDAITFFDALPIGVGIGLVENQYSIVVGRGTHFPTKVKKRYFTSKNNQETAHIEIFEGERLLADRNRKLGEITVVKLPPGPAGDVYIDVVFSFDQNGILSVLAKGQNGEESEFTVDYKSMRAAGEPIEVLLRKLESSRKDDEGLQMIAQARTQLLQNIEHIRINLNSNLPHKIRSLLEKRCDEVQSCLNNHENDRLESLTKLASQLEHEASAAFNSHLLQSEV